MAFIPERHFPSFSMLLLRSCWNGGWGSRQQTTFRGAVLWASAVSCATAALRVVFPEDAIPQKSCARPMTQHYKEHEATYLLDIKLPQCFSAAKPGKYCVADVLWAHNTWLELTTCDFPVTCFTALAVAFSCTYLV